ncbi:hypothetical protein [Aeromicrobium endophyticum]|nr:hypothetical protein [Aeromicrobium endophyticum]
MNRPDLRMLLRDRRHWRGTVHELCEIRADGSVGGVIASAKQSLDRARLTLVFHTDVEHNRPLFAFASDHVWDTWGTYAVTDDRGVVLGSFRKDVKASFGRSTWHLETADGITAVGRERSRLWALVRRFSDDPPLRFDFATGDGHVVLSTARRWVLRREYDLALWGLPDGRRLDWRLAAAVGSGVTLLQRD